MFWFTSDHHLFHKNILKFSTNQRPYIHYEQMSYDIIVKHNSKVGVNDTVFFLGDLAFGDRQNNLRKTLPFFNGRKYLILGNHDLGFKQLDSPKALKNHVEFYKSLGFIDVFPKGVILENIHPRLPERIRLSHFPYSENLKMDYDRGLEKFAPTNDGLLLLYGHTHQTEVLKYKNSIHVGLDSWQCYPVSIEQVVQIFNSPEASHMFQK